MTYIEEIEKYYTVFGRTHWSHDEYLRRRITSAGGTISSSAADNIAEFKRLVKKRKIA